MFEFQIDRHGNRWSQVHVTFDGDPLITLTPSELSQLYRQIGDVLAAAYKEGADA